MGRQTKIERSEADVQTELQRIVRQVDRPSQGAIKREMGERETDRQSDIRIDR